MFDNLSGHTSYSIFYDHYYVKNFCELISIFYVWVVMKLIMCLVMMVQVNVDHTHWSQITSHNENNLVIFC